MTYIVNVQPVNGRRKRNNVLTLFFLLEILFLRMHYGLAELAVIVGGKTECTVSKLMGEATLLEAPHHRKLAFFTISPCEG